MAISNPHITYTAVDIENYLSGKLTAQEMHAIEKQALQDPFLADAIEGYSNTNPKNTAKHLQQIHQTITKKQGERFDKTVITSISKNNKKIWLSAAACIAVGIVCLSIFYGDNDSNKNKDIASLNVNNTKDTQPKDIVEIIENSAEEVKATPPTTSNQPNLPTKNDDVQNTTSSISTNSNQLNTSNNNKDVKQLSLIAEQEKDISANTTKAAELAVTNQNNSNINKPPYNTTEQKEANANDQVANKSTTNTAIKPQNITGKVVNQSNEPVPFATIQLNNTKQFATTNAEGVFNFRSKNLSDSNLFLNVNAIGYQNQQANVSSNNNNIIKLNNDDHQLNEVVVTNLAKNSVKKSFSNNAVKSIQLDSTLIPQGGWEAYEKYLAKNNAYSTLIFDSTNNEFSVTKQLNPSQEVVLSFVVDDDGAPINIKIEKSQSKEAGNKAVEILKNGPKWRSTNAKKKSKVTLVIK